MIRGALLTPHNCMTFPVTFTTQIWGANHQTKSKNDIISDVISTPCNNKHPVELRHSLVKLTRSCSTCVFQHGCSKKNKKYCLCRAPTGRPSGSLFLPPSLPLFTLHWSAASRVQYKQSYTQTQWHCPAHGSLNNTGIRTLGKPTGF